MSEIILHRYWLPARVPGGREHLSRWAMSEEEAKARGAIRPEATSREVRQVSDGDVNGSFSHLGRFPDKQ